MTAASTNAYTSAHAVTRSIAVSARRNGESITIAIGLSGRTPLMIRHLLLLVLVTQALVILIP